MRRAWLFEVSESPSRGYWKHFLLSRPYEYGQYLPVVEGDNLPRGKVSPPHLNPHVYFHFYVMIKGMGRAWLFEVSDSPSKGYWKQFLLSRPYEHSQNLLAADGDPLPLGKVVPPTPPPGVKCPPTQPSCMLSFLCNDKGNEKSLII